MSCDSSAQHVWLAHSTQFRPDQLNTNFLNTYLLLSWHSTFKLTAKSSRTYLAEVWWGPRTPWYTHWHQLKSSETPGNILCRMGTALQKDVQSFSSFSHLCSALVFSWFGIITVLHSTIFSILSLYPKPIKLQNKQCSIYIWLGAQSGKRAFCSIYEAGCHSWVEFSVSQQPVSHHQLACCE